jgi:glycogen synthase
MKVLLIAEQANPEWVSVPLVGWSMSKAIADVVDAHIVTQVRNRDAFVRAGLREAVDFSVIDNESVAGPMNTLIGKLRGGDGKGWTTATALQTLAYYSFERLLWERFAPRLEAREFDIVHRVTPLTPTAPSTLAAKCARIDVPFVLGPLNGGLPWPPGFENRRRAEKEWLSYVRGLYRLLPGYSSSRSKSAAILVGSLATRAQMPQRFQRKMHYLPENGIDPTRFSARRTRRSRLPLVGVFVGRLVEYKCPDLLVKAASEFIRAGQLRLKIVGDGPLKSALEAYVAQEGIGHGVDFLGWLDHKNVQSALIDSDFLALPSIREFGGGVVLEAMAVGVPVVVADYGGPAELVNDKIGFKVPFHDERSLESGLSAVFRTLVQRPETLDEMSRNAAAEVEEHYTWAAKARKVRDVYEQLLAKRSQP